MSKKPRTPVWWPRMKVQGGRNRTLGKQLRWNFDRLRVETGHSYNAWVGFVRAYEWVGNDTELNTAVYEERPS